MEYTKALKAAGNTAFLNETKNTIHGFDMESKGQIVIDRIDKRIKYSIINMENFECGTLRYNN